jgi:tetratricopeptide (TPR) repeat protein
MTEKEFIDDLAKAEAFFQRAQKVSQSGNFDYAIDMFLEGLRRSPDALEQGHIPLCELAFHRQGKNAKKPTILEKAKRMMGKTPLEQLLNAEYLFAKDPSHLPYAEAMLKAATLGGYIKTAEWIANFIFQTNNAAKKPSLHTYILLKDSYEAIGKYDKAIVACQKAVKLKPESAELADEYKRLAAELTVARGKYDTDGDFRKSIKNRQAQEVLQSQDGVVKTSNYRKMAVAAARAAIANDPDLSKNIYNLADVLSGLENDQGENEAIELLENAYNRKEDFSYMQNAGLIKIKQLKRKIRHAKTVLKAEPDDAQTKSTIAELSGKLQETELEHYRLCMENYPTDTAAKYEYGIRLFKQGQYDQAIPLFQEAQRDPKLKIAAMGRIGLCFFQKGWQADAIDIFTAAMNSHELKDDAIGKELRYNLARCYQQQGSDEKALEIYRWIAQRDFNYKDVRHRIDELRNSE